MGDEHDLVRGSLPDEESRGEEKNKKASSSSENGKTFAAKKNACIKLLSVSSKLNSRP